MNKMVAVLNFKYRYLLSNPKFLLPFGFLIVMQMIHYSTVTAPPTAFLRYLFLAEIFTFVAAVWLGASSNQFFDETTEKLLILRLQSGVKFYLIFAVFLAGLAFVLSVVTTAFPIVFSFTGLFDTFSFRYAFATFLLTLGSSFAGITLGALTSPRLLKKKEEGAFIAIIFCLLAVVAAPLSAAYPWTRFIMWFFPHTSHHGSLIETSADLTFLKVFVLFLINVIYGVVYTIIRTTMLNLKKF